VNILFISQYFPPENGAAPERAFEFARNLSGNGHAVQVITGLPNHPSGEILPEYRGRFFLRETIEGIPVTRTYLYASPKKNPLSRLLNHCSFAASSLLGRPSGFDPDVVLATVPPLFAGLSGLAFSSFLGKPLVLDVRDLWPQAAVDLGELREGLAVRSLASVEEMLYRRADRIAVVTRGIHESLLRRGVPAEKATRSFSP
jgi:hypothetical protein